MVIEYIIIGTIILALLNLDKVYLFLKGLKGVDDFYVKNRLKIGGLNLTPNEQKHNDEIDRLNNEERKKNFQKTGFRETNKERRDREKDEARRKRLQAKFGDDIALKIKNNELSVGMTKEMVIEMKKKSDHTTQSVSRGKEREEWFYGKHENRLGNYNYKFRVVFVNGLVEGWNDIKGKP